MQSAALSVPYGSGRNIRHKSETKTSSHLQCWNGFRNRQVKKYSFSPGCSGLTTTSKCICTSSRRGTIMLFCIVVNALLALMAIGILKTLSIHASTASAVESNEKADYLAQAGLQRALEVLESNPGWQGSLKWNDRKTSLTGDSETRRYQVRVKRDSKGTTTISSQGTFGLADRTRQLVLNGGGGSP